MTAKICPTCHTAIPPDAPGGICPACALRGADELVSPAAPGAPLLEEVRAAFPQLEVEGLIGQGGMGFVYKAQQPSLGRTVALKILSPELSRDPAFAERFAREARVLGQLSHPNIVTVFEHGQSGGFYYLLMEYVDGVNLRQAMRAGRFTPEQALAVVPGVCDALQAAHARGVWHRDIKPENILLDARGGVKIADFGIARIVGDPARDFTLTATGGKLGSAAYMAPEQHESPHDVDHRADIYSLGVVFYEMLTGELPLGRFKAPSEKSAVDARIDEIVLRTLEKERELRQQSAEQVKTEVSRAAEPAKAAARPSVFVAPSPLRVSVIAAIGGAALIAFVAFLTAGTDRATFLHVGLIPLAIGLAGMLVFKRSAQPAGAERRIGMWLAIGIVLVTGLVAAVAYYGQLRREYAARDRLAAERKADEAAVAAKLASQKSAAESVARDWEKDLANRSAPGSPKDDPFQQWAQQMKNGDLARQKGDSAEALKFFERAAVGADAEFNARMAAAKRKGQDAGHEPAMRRNWCLWQSRMRAGDMLCELDRLDEAATAYTAAAAVLDELMVQNKAHPSFPSAKVADALASAFVKVGDVAAARNEAAAATDHYRAAVAVMIGGERRGDRWKLSGKREFGGDLSQPFDEEELLRAAVRVSAKPNDYGSKDWQTLRQLLGLACAYKSERIRFLLEDEKVVSSQPLSMAALDWSLNGNGKALDFILKSLATQKVGSDCDEPAVLAYVDEWERSAPAVDAHFTQTDGAGGTNLRIFWQTRQYLFPRNYLRYKHPQLEGAPLKKADATPAAAPSPEPEADAAKQATTAGDSSRRFFHRTSSRDAWLRQRPPEVADKMPSDIGTLLSELGYEGRPTGGRKPAPVSVWGHAMSNFDNDNTNDWVIHVHSVDYRGRKISGMLLYDQTEHGWTCIAKLPGTFPVGWDHEFESRKGFYTQEPIEGEGGNAQRMRYYRWDGKRYIEERVEIARGG